jgi:imidazolonepropionase-like amidohydrolase/Tol biopolymer transport system component
MRGVNRLLVAALWTAFAVGCAAAPTTPAEVAPPTPAAATLTVAADTARAGRARDPLPLEPERTVRLELSRGTWMSVDVSPDGRTLVFDHLGNLFTLPIEGGAAVPLTTGMSFDAQPRFSPDGTRVAFTSDRDGGDNVWIISLDLQDTVQVTRGRANRAESPAWAPDANYIVASVGAFRGQAQPVLRLYHVEGGSGAQLMRGEDEPKAIGAAFGPDPRWVWFAQRTGSRDWDYNAQFPQYMIRAYDRETGRTYTRVTRYGSAFSPTPSPDGRWLVYGTRHEAETGLVLRDLATGEERWLAYPVQRDDQESRATLGVLPGMAFTPDSRHLVASWDGRLWKVPVAGGAAEEIPFRVAYDQPMGPLVEFEYRIEDDPAFTVRQIRDAVPSPDGRRLALTALNRLYVADADGSNPRPLTPGTASEHQPAWSPDGRWIAYVMWDGDQGHIMRVAADGRGSTQRVTREGGVYLTPAWSPDGSRIVALRGQARAFREATSPFAAMGAAEELVWIPATGGAATLIAPRAGRSSPHFVAGRPDRIFLSGAQGHLVSTRWDGTDDQQHIRVRGETTPGSREPTNASLVQMAPTGDQALAVVGGQIYAVVVPMVGGEPTTISVAEPERAQFPARRLTELGGEFPAWSGDGRRVHWSLGNAHFVYDLDEARARDDELRALARRRGERSPAPDPEPEPEPEPEPDPDPVPDPEPEPEPHEAPDPVVGVPPAEADTARYQPREHRVRVTARRDRATGAAVLRGARLITMRGDEVIEDGELVVRDNRIVAVGPRGSVDVPADARVIDVAGRTIVPGFVDVHAHMWPQWGVHRTDQWHYLANLAYGVTTTRDPQTSTTDVLTYADLVRTGQAVGPRIYSTGPGVFWQENFRDYDHVERTLRRYSDYFDTQTIKMYVAGNRQQRQWIIQASRKLGLMPTTEGSLNIRQNLTETIDGYPGLEHSIPISPVHDDVVRLFAESRRAYTPTLLVAYGGPWAENHFFQTEDVYGDPKLRRFTPQEALARLTRRRSQWFLPEEHVFERHARFVADLVAGGGRAAVGSHGQLQGLGFHWELWAMQSGGLPEHDALRVATLMGAEAIGLARDLGSLEPGKLADLVVLDANPLHDIRNTNTVRYIMIDGRLHDGDTLQELYPGTRDPLAGRWWRWDAITPAPGLPGADRAAEGAGVTEAGGPLR